MRKTTLIVASVLASVAVNVASAAETKGVVTIEKDQTTASFKVTPAKGKYQIKTSVASTVVVKQGETLITPTGDVYTLDAKEYTISVELSAPAAANTDVTVWCYDDAKLAEIDAVYNRLTSDLTTSVNKAKKSDYTDDKYVRELLVTASTDQDKINDAYKAVSGASLSTEAGWAAYLEFVANNSYLNSEDGAAKDLKTLNEGIVGAIANVDCHAAAVQAYNEMKSDAVKGVAALDNAYAAAQQAIKDAYKSQYDARKAEIEQFKKDVDDAYEAGTCGSYTDEAIAKIKNAYVDGDEASIPALIDAITSNNTALADYTDVLGQISAAKTYIATKDAELYEYLINTNPYPEFDINGKNREIYEDKYAAALTEMNAVLRDINNKVTLKNSKEPGKGISPADASNIINDAKSTLNVIVAKYKGEVRELRRNYYIACYSVNSLLNSYKNKVKNFCQNDADTKKFYASDIKNLEDQLAGLQADIDAANAAHTIKGNADNYTEAYNDLLKVYLNDYNDVYPKVQNSSNEERAYKDSVKKIAAIQKKLDDAKTAVGKLKVDKKQDLSEYKVLNRFENTITELQTSITTLTTENNEAYTVNDNGAYDAENKAYITTAKGYNNGIADKISLITTDVNNYKSDATAIKNKLATIYTQYDNAMKSYKALVEYVGNDTDVTTDGNVLGDSNKTYATAMQEQKTLIDNAKKAINDALALNDASTPKTHYQAVADLSIPGSIKATLDNLKNDFDTNKSKWEQNNIDAACTKLLAEANKQIAAADAIVGTEYDIETYGKRANNDWQEGDKTIKALNTQRLALNDIKVEAAGKVAAAGSAPYSKEDLAILQEVVKTLDTDVLGGFQTLQTLADKVKEDYTKEKNLKAEYEKAIAAINLDINGDGKTGADHKKLSIMEIAKDEYLTDYRDDLAVKVGEAQGKLNALETAVGTSFGNETLVKDDKDVADPKTDGYATRKTNIEAEVAALIEDAKKIAANYAAWKDVNDYLTTDKVGKTEKTYQTNINDAQSDLDDFYTLAGTSVETQAFYNGKVAAEQAEMARINTANEEDYTKLEVNNNATLIFSIDESVKRVNMLKAAAEVNEKAYKGEDFTSTKACQVKSAADALSEWAKLQEKVAVKAEVNKEHYEEWSTKLGEFKKAIERYKENTKKAYNEGKAADDAFNNDIAQVVKDMALFSASFDGEYADAVTKDNTERKDAFDKAYTALTTSYSKNVNDIAALSRLKLAENVEFLLYLVTADGTHSYTIYQLAEVIRNLNAEAGETYAETIGTETIWDKDKTYQSQAEDLKKEIEDKVKLYTNQINYIAEQELEVHYDAAKDKYDSTIANMAKWDNTVICDGVPTNEDLLAAMKAIDDCKNKTVAAKDANGNYVNQTFAVDWENKLKPALEKVDALCTSGLDASAAAQWAAEKDNFQALAAAETEDIKGFCKQGETAGYYSKEYAGIVAAVNKAIADKEKEVKNVVNYNNYVNKLDAALGTFCHNDLVTRGADTAEDPFITHTKEYWNAFDAYQLYLGNDDAYAEHLPVVAEYAVIANEAIDFANELLSRYDVYVTYYRQSLETCSTDYAKDLETAHKDGTSVTFVNNDAPTYQGDIELYVDELKNTSLLREVLAIEDECKDLEFDRDKASAQLIAIEGVAVDELLAGWKDQIDAIKAENKSIYDAYTIGKVDENGDPILDENGDPVKATPEETKAAYLALEKKIGKLKTEIKSYSDEADKKLDADMIQKLNDDLAEVYGILNSTNLVHNKVKAEYEKQLEALKQEAAGIQKLIDAAEADQTILIDAKNIAIDINGGEAGWIHVEGLNYRANILKTKVATEEKKWNDSDKRYSNLAKSYSNSIALLNKFNEIAGSYAHQCTDTKGWLIDEKKYENYREYKYDEFKIALDATNNALTSNKANDVLLTPYEASSQQSKYNTVNDDIKELLKELSYINMLQTASNEVYDAVWFELDQEYFEPSDYTMLTKAQNALNSKIGRAITYGSDSYSYEKVWRDIDGEELLNEKGEIISSIAKTFVTVDNKNTEGYYEVMARFQEIIAEANELQKQANELSVLVGDVNNDDELNINDYAALANIILEAKENTLTGKDFKRADVKRDEEINVSDLAELVKKIKNYYESHARTFIAADNSNDQVTVDVENDVLSIGINNDVNYVGMQMDITLPSGASVLTEELAARAENHELMVNNLGNNKYRVLVISGENEAFGGHEGALFNLGLTNFHGTVAIDNIIFTDADAHTYKFTLNGGATAINGVDAQQTVGEKIYSVGGQLMNGLKKGVNIVKGAAKTVKVIK